VKATIDASDYAQLADYWQRSPDITRTVLMRAMTVIDLDLQNTLKRDLPKGAGGAAGLQGSVTTEEHALADNVIGMTYSSLPQAVFVELGTKPHPVSEEGVQALADWVQAKFGESDEESALSIAHAVAWKIRRKGTPANPVWQRTWDAKQPYIREVFDGAMRRIAAELARSGA